MKRTKDTLPHRAIRYGSVLQAFTLVELLIVIALTGLLLALLLGPLIQAFGLTARARALAEAQDATRFGMERLKRELSQAAYVFDNTNMPLVLPIGPAELDGSIAAGDRRDVSIYPVQNGVSTPRPMLLYAKIDFRPIATDGEGPGTVHDPTTGKPLGGTRIVLPGAPGQRIVRYFIGLSDNLPRRQNPDGSGPLIENEDQYRKRAYYRNVYEFPRWDTDLNPFLLYRVEFDPTDPNLVDLTQTNAFGPGGLHDPNFFYNFNAATSVRQRDNRAGNGRTYAENWRKIANPILATKNLDVLAWRRGTDRQIVPGNPFQLQISFSPSTVAGDAATPGYLSNTQAEAPGAVPTLYSAKFSQWVYPFTVTFFRGSTEYPGGNRPARPNDPYGEVRFTFEKVEQPNGSVVQEVSLQPNAAGTLQTQDYYWLLDSATGKMHVFSANLAFTVDPTRGRVETAFPALATQNGIPLFMPPGARIPSAMQPGPSGNFGQLVPMALVQNTRDDDPNDEIPYGETSRVAGQTYGNGLYVPANQGIIRSELFDRPNGAFRYYPLNSFPPTGTGFASPFNVFGDIANATPYKGIMVVPGSEMVSGPDNFLTLDTPRNPGDTPKLLLTTYYRVPAAVGTLAKKAIVNGIGPNSLYSWAGQANYRLESDLGNYNAPYLQFDQPPNSTTLNTSAGLPAVQLGAGNGAPQGLLRVTYLWQNNYSRNQLGQPINVRGEPTTNNMGAPGAIVLDRNRVRPEADVVKVDYATRSLMNVAVGARVYDTSAKVPQSAQISDKITVNNVGR